MASQGHDEFKSYKAHVSALNKYFTNITVLSVYQTQLFSVRYYHNFLSCHLISLSWYPWSQYLLSSLLLANHQWVVNRVWNPQPQQVPTEWHIYIIQCTMIYLEFFCKTCKLSFSFKGKCLLYWRQFPHLVTYVKYIDTYHIGELISQYFMILYKLEVMKQRYMHRMSYHRV